MGVEKVRRKFAVKGALVFGTGDAGLERGAANVVSPLSGDTFRGTIDGASVVSLAGGEVRIGTAVAALGTTTHLPTAKAGLIKVGHSLGTAQLGFVHNGTAFVLEGTVGGNVILRVNPAGA